MANTTAKYLGLELKNPIIVGSSGLTDQVGSIQKLEKAGAGAVVLKSLFEEEIIIEKESKLSQMNTNGFIYPETIDFYEYDNGPKEKSAEYLELIQNLKKNVNIPIIASINCITASQWTFFPRELEMAGADALELNLFIMPSDLNRSAEDNDKIYFEIIGEVKKQIRIPLSVKISYYFSNLATMIKKISETGVSGIVLFNRFYSPDFDIDTFDITSGNVLSAPGDLALSLRWIAIMSDRVKCDLAASTGVHDGQDLIKQLLAGANAVQVVSAIYKFGPGYITKMLDELNAWMDKHGFKSLDQFVGKMSQSASLNPASFERVQFMRYFRGFAYKGN
ncbi:MAG: dihydroorotate dehydrogenase-like protein [Bacteroidales bacterium]|nr:dihydroorotate dehydrogenase-like protein [Bacteroidales bacterium]